MFLLPSQTTLPHDPRSVDSYCLDTENVDMWCDSPPLVPAYTLVVQGTYWTLPMPSETAPKFCSIARQFRLASEFASVKQQLHWDLWMQDSNHGDKMYTQRTLQREPHQFIDWGGWTLLPGSF